MTLQTRLRQVWTIARMEVRRTFLSKRSFWVYALALFPSVIFIGHGIDTKFRQERYTRDGVTPAAKIELIAEGDTPEQAIAKAGRPIRDNDFTERRRIQRDPDTEDANEAPAVGRTNRPNRDDEEVREVEIQHRNMMYFDGKSRTDLHFRNGILESKRTRALVNFDEDRQVFAAVFHYFYLRLAIFFGCLGIFMNLFRGEMLDKTLHYWLLLPVRREVLLGGKYVAGLIAATAIFTFGAMLCFAAMLWPQDPAQVSTYWSINGPAHLARYAAAAALACVGYGSAFLAAGLLVRNPIVPAVVLMLWESINGFLPDVLQKISVIYYARSICPTLPPTDPNMPALLRMILSPAEPAPALIAVLGLLALTALVLWAASRSVRRLEINYGGD